MIQTFLFITNNGTPEGDKLNELMGLNKADKIYWEIDKLSTFMETNFEKNDSLKQLFLQAGCKSLFDLKLKQQSKQQERKERLKVGLTAMLSDFVKKTTDTKNSQQE